MKDLCNEDAKYEVYDASAKEQVFSICRKLQKLIPPIRLNSLKADETIRYWLPEIPSSLITRYKEEFIEQTRRQKKI